MDETHAKQVDVLHAEYGRFCDALNEHAAAEDWNLIGIMGATLAWIPLAEFINTKVASETNYFSSLLLVGFVTAASIAGIQGVRTVLRLSFIYFFVDQLRRYEGQINELLGFSDAERGINNHEAWGRWQSKKHAAVFWIYVIIRLGFFAGFPPIVFYQLTPQEASANTQVYLCVFAVVMVLVVAASVLLVRNPSKNELE